MSKQQDQTGTARHGMFTDYHQGKPVTISMAMADGDWVKYEDHCRVSNNLIDAVESFEKKLTKSDSDLKSAEIQIQSQVKVMNDQYDKIRKLTKGA